jgi:hypothetical protein
MGWWWNRKKHKSEDTGHPETQKLHVAGVDIEVVETIISPNYGDHCFSINITNPEKVDDDLGLRMESVFNHFFKKNHVSATCQFIEHDAQQMFSITPHNLHALPSIKEVCMAIAEASTHPLHILAINDNTLHEEPFYQTHFASRILYPWIYKKIDLFICELIKDTAFNKENPAHQEALTTLREEIREGISPMLEDYKKAHPVSQTKEEKEGQSKEFLQELVNGVISQPLAKFETTIDELESCHIENDSNLHHKLCATLLTALQPVGNVFLERGR